MDCLHSCDGDYDEELTVGSEIRDHSEFTLFLYDGNKIFGCWKKPHYYDALFEIGLVSLFFDLCHKKRRKNITQKHYDKVFSDSAGSKHLVVINYLIVKHDVGIIIKMCGTETERKKYHRYIMQGIGE